MRNNYTVFGIWLNSLICGKFSTSVWESLHLIYIWHPLEHPPRLVWHWSHSLPQQRQGQRKHLSADMCCQALFVQLLSAVCLVWGRMESLITIWMWWWFSTEVSLCSESWHFLSSFRNFADPSISISPLRRMAFRGESMSSREDLDSVEPDLEIWESFQLCFFT